LIFHFSKTVALLHEFSANV